MSLLTVKYDLVFTGRPVVAALQTLEAFDECCIYSHRHSQGFFHKEFSFYNEKTSFWK